MTEPELLRAVGLALYPERSWKADMAHELVVNSRRVRHWANGEEKVPDGVWHDIHTLLEIKRRVVDDAIEPIVHLIIEKADPHRGAMDA